MAGVCFAYQKGGWLLVGRADGCRVAVNFAIFSHLFIIFDLLVIYSLLFCIGECSRDNCKFLHEQSSESSGAFSNFGSSNRQGSYGSSRGASGICYSYQRGECNRGESCRFSHDGDSSSPSNGAFRNFSNTRSNFSDRSSAKSGTCYAFQRGECDRGDSCRFSHGSSFNRGFSSPKSGNCFAFQRGECSRGDGCRFSHEVGGDAPASFSSGSKPCFSFQKGNCDRGDTCKFSHAPIAPEQEGFAY